MVLLYHYTDKAGSDGITRSGYIKAQLPHGGTVNMPFGVYLTELPPNMYPREIYVANNYDDGAAVQSNQNLLRKTDFYVPLDSAYLPGVYKRASARNEWVYPNDIPLVFNASNNVQVTISIHQR